MDVKISEKWNEYLERFPVDFIDIYYREEYVKLYETEQDKALCIICISGEQIALMPFLRRSVNQYYDFETAYGYGGPIFNVKDVKWANDSLQAMRMHFSSNGYLCGFIRFHPLINNAEQCKEQIKVLYDRNTISILTQTSIDDIWSDQINSKNRNMIRKAEKNGLTYRVESDYASIKDFVYLYNKTMDRLNAEDFYFFDKKYYQKFIKNIADRGFLGIVTLENKIVGAALFMNNDRYGHYHLAGSDRNYSSLGINNFLLWNTVREMKKRNVNIFHLGGGTSGDTNDSLYKFKKAFSPNENKFYIGKWIFDDLAYEKICEKWEKDNPDIVNIFGNRLLKYRYTREDI